LRKSIANGFPVGATIATEEVANAFTGLSLSTFGGNPISMAAVDVTMDVMQRENTPRRSAERGKQLRDALEEFKKRFAFIGDVRGMGLMQGIEFVETARPKTVAQGRRRPFSRRRSNRASSLERAACTATSSASRPRC